MKNNKNKGKAFIAAIICITIVIVVTVMGFIRSVSQTVVSFTDAKIRALAVSAINDSVFEIMSDEISYSDLVTVKNDNDGKTELLIANTANINRIAVKTAQTGEANLRKIGVQDIMIPMGTLTGVALFAGKGPLVTVSVEPVGSVICRFTSKFEAAGINQTRHRIYLDIITNVDVIMPTSVSNIVITLQVFIAESVLIGTVPETYLNFNGNGSNLLDLVP